MHPLNYIQSMDLAKPILRSKDSGQKQQASNNKYFSANLFFADHFELLDEREAAMH